MEAEKWQREEGVSYVFHYTEAAAARQIASDANFLVGGGARFGSGLYATDLAPDEAGEEEIRAVCFEGDGASIAYSGVLVLLADDPLTPFEEVDKRVFLLADGRVVVSSRSTRYWWAWESARRPIDGRLRLGHSSVPVLTNEC